MISISCIIPAYNESKSISATIKSVLPLLGKEISELIIINDCSTDNTLEKINPFLENPNIHLISNTTNLGKSRSVAKAIKSVKGSHIFLLDADLLNLETKDLLNLITPIHNQTTDVSFAFIQNARPLRPFKKIDYCSGQRILPTWVLKNRLNHLSQLPSYGLEVFVNKLIIKQNLRLQVIARPNVSNDMHQNKDWRYLGRKKNLKIWRDIIKISGGLRNIYKMNIDLEKCLISKNNPDLQKF